MTSNDFFPEDPLPYGTTSNKYSLTFRDIVLQHLQKIGSLASLEFRGGYWQQKTETSKEGQEKTSRVYIPDTREQYMNAINYLHDILIPYFDKAMDSASEKCEKAIKDLRIKCLSKTERKEENLLDTDKNNTTLLSTDCYTGQDKIILEAFKFSKLQHIRKLFQELTKFLQRWNYGEVREIID